MPSRSCRKTCLASFSFMPLLGLMQWNSSPCMTSSITKNQWSSSLTWNSCRFTILWCRRLRRISTSRSSILRWPSKSAENFIFSRETTLTAKSSSLPSSLHLKTLAKVPCPRSSRISNSLPAAPNLKPLRTGSFRKSDGDNSVDELLCRDGEVCGDSGTSADGFVAVSCPVLLSCVTGSSLLPGALSSMTGPSLLPGGCPGGTSLPFAPEGVTRNGDSSPGSADV
mmetsp:Transcript_13471/g.40173  ORF Transcript_13471/g.40173 Transcript_13471/m.40173 type:complete len:225 (+) Transcript_13471:1317-1991(+)